MTPTTEVGMIAIPDGIMWCLPLFTRKYLTVNYVYVEELVVNCTDVIGMFLFTVDYNSLCLSRLVKLTLSTNGYGFRLILDYEFP